MKSQWAVWSLFLLPVSISCAGDEPVRPGFGLSARAARLAAELPADEPVWEPVRAPGMNAAPSGARHQAHLNDGWAFHPVRVENGVEKPLLKGDPEFSLMDGRPGGTAPAPGIPARCGCPRSMATG